MAYGIGIHISHMPILWYYNIVSTLLYCYLFIAIMYTDVTIILQRCIRYYNNVKNMLASFSTDSSLYIIYNNNNNKFNSGQSAFSR